MNSINKSISIIISILFLGMLSAFSTISGNVKEADFRVDGVCSMCKERIENAALIKGVKKVDWDKDTQMLHIIYNPKKVDLDKVYKSLAEAGHSTEKYKAVKTAYNKLPSCCKYNDNVDVH